MEAAVPISTRGLNALHYLARITDRQASPVLRAASAIDTVSFVSGQTGVIHLGPNIPLEGISQ